MRSILKTVLQLLSSLAIKKHEIEIILVNGWIGEEIVKEGIYTLLSETFIVRRNVKKIWWDLSIPLNILGYEDRRRTFIEWILLIIRVMYVLTYGKRNKHILVLSAQSANQNTAKYWSGFVKPEVLVVVNNLKDSPVTKKLMETAKKSKCKIVISQKDSIAPKSLKVGFGSDKEAKIQVKSTPKNISITYGELKLKLKNLHTSPYESDIAACIIGTSLIFGLKIDDVVSGLSKFDLRNMYLQKVSISLNE